MIKVESSLIRRPQKQGIAYMRWAHSQMRALWKDCINAFIFEAMFAMVGPDTGMSRGQLLPLAGVLGIRSQAGSVARLNAKYGFRGAFDPQGNWHPQLMRNINLGARYGRDAYKVDYGSHTNAVFQFHFHLVVWQSKLYEDTKIGKHGPAHAMQAGAKAFNDYFDSNLHKYLPESAFRFFLRYGRVPNLSGQLAK